MAYHEYKPAPQLANCIDAYWSVTTSALPGVQRILPDSCADIIISLGATVVANKGGINETVMRADKAYLVGTMTTFCDTHFENEAHIVGIRFKPFALHSMLGMSLSGMVNKTHELGASDFCFKQFITSKNINHLQSSFDAFLFNRLHTKERFAMEILDSIYQSNGMITISALTKKHFITERQLERLCQLKTGITIKELCKQVRFRHMMNLLKNGKQRQSVTDIAMETGYYDYSHLAREVKQYTGNTPAYYMQ